MNITWENYTLIGGKAASQQLCGFILRLLAQALFLLGIILLSKVESNLNGSQVI